MFIWHFSAVKLALACVYRIYIDI